MSELLGENEAGGWGSADLHTNLLGILFPFLSSFSSFFFFVGLNEPNTK